MSAEPFTPRNDEPARIPALAAPYPDDVADLLRRMVLPAARAHDPIYTEFAARRTPAIFATLVRNRPLGEVIARLRSFTHGESGVPARQRELLAHRVTARLGAEYEWSLHAEVYGTKLGLDQDTIDATVTASPTDPRWTTQDTLTLWLADELLETNGISDELWAQLSERYDTQILLSMLFLVGFYATNSWLMNGIRVAPEPDTPLFPGHRATGAHS